MAKKCEFLKLSVKALLGRLLVIQILVNHLHMWNGTLRHSVSTLIRVVHLRASNKRTN